MEPPTADLTELLSQLLAAHQEATTVAVFVDSNNLYHAVRRQWHQTGKIQIDYLKLRDRLVGKRFLAETVFFYHASAADNDAGRRLVSHLERHRVTCVRTASARAVTSDIQKYIADYVQKRPRVSTIILVSGDGDFCETAAHLRRDGVRLEVAFLGQQASLELRAAAHRFTDLDPCIYDLKVEPQT